MSRTGMASFVALPLLASLASGATTQKHYYAHDAVEDAHGVIAPWYKGQNGQMDLRVRIAAETLKRYPWTSTDKAVAAVPEYVFSGAWSINKEGKIAIPPIDDWANGDLGQRAAYVLAGLVDYYRYSGDPAAIAHLSLMADTMLKYCQTPVDHPWPEFLISVPTQGKPYGKANPHGFIQLDIVAEVGIPLVKAALIADNTLWLAAARHWGDLLAEKRNTAPGVPPWGRYANPQDVPWEDHMTGGVVFLLEFFDTLIHTNYTGHNNSIVEARKAGVAYLRDVLLPRWTVNDVWGRNYWDWHDAVQAENVTEFAARYVMEHPDDFPNWKNDARNILTIFLNHTGVSPGSNGNVYHGAWAYPESSGCCGRSLWYGPMEIAPMYAQFGVLSGNTWAREIGRRQMILATYDVHETGVVEDNIDGGQIVAGAWFKIAHPMALKHCLNMIAWQPELFSPARENHIVRSTSVVTNVQYSKVFHEGKEASEGYISYSTADAPPNTLDVLRLSFSPKHVLANGQELPLATSGDAPGYRMQPLTGGDCIVTIRHDGSRDVIILGDDPQHMIDDDAMKYSGKWENQFTVGTSRPVTAYDPESFREQSTAKDYGVWVRHASETGADMTHNFKGNQVRVIGRSFPKGGLADVYIDGVKQLCGIDAWSPITRYQQMLYFKNGLQQGDHTIRVVVRGEHNPVSEGNEIYIDGLQWSDATATSDFGAGGGPTDVQRWIFGYSERQDYTDSKGNTWQPATEWVARSANLADSVAANWWNARRRLHIEGTSDPELYRYGAHAHEFWADFTVAPGTYHVRLRFAETRNIDPKLRAMNIAINGREVVHNFDIASTAANGRSQLNHAFKETSPTWTGLNRAVDLVFNGIEPKHGVISIQFTGSQAGEAIVQAIEVGPGNGGQGAVPASIPTTAPASKAASSK